MTHCTTFSQQYDLIMQSILVILTLLDSALVYGLNARLSVSCFDLVE